MIAIRKCFTKMHLFFGRLLPFLQQTFGNIAQAEMEKKPFSKWAMDVAHLVERSFLTPEINSSNRVIGNFLLPSTVLKRRKKERRNREWAKLKIQIS